MFKNQKGFTLIEMLIVLMIISVLIILIVPNLASKSKDVNEKGCDALKAVVQSQADAYYVDKKKNATDTADLVSGKYITDEQTSCPNGDPIVINDGKVAK
ncbi:competence type IV pilus major pilin ComGC [Lentibacillus sp. N15]|uniref:competence type IV pilus major pilin ComGC n=1 Tax=Lentibacillus songyuanensis TaxID=3136161 RepID=UPI0031BA35FB